MAKFYSVGFEATSGLLFDNGIDFYSYACKDAIEDCADQGLKSFDAALKEVSDYGRRFYPDNDEMFVEFNRNLNLIKHLNTTGKWIVWGAETDWSMGFIVE